MKIGIFGGSFDPVHNGHINLAQYVLDHTDLDEVWLMVSPLNPLKPQGYVASDADRLKMARLAVSGHPGIKVSDFEFSLPIPSYTYNTLKKLKEAYPDDDFRLIIGGDNWAHFDQWRNPQEILNEFGLIVYPRPGEKIEVPESCKQTPGASTRVNSQLNIDNSSLIILKDAPQMPVSSTQIRQALHASVNLNSSLSALHSYLPSSVLDYIRTNHLYQ